MDGNLDYIVSALEAKKKVAPNGEFLWFARDLSEILGYTDWRHFRSVIEKAKDASNNAGIFSNDHFVQFDEVIVVGKGAKSKRENLLLSRHACYLIAMNADSSKPEVATAQNYFAIQTQRQESERQLSDEQRRLLLRNRVKDGNKSLGAAAYAAGVTGANFGIFHDAGYKGLYDGRGRDAIKQLKGIPEDEDILDCMDRVELAANDFRITQTDQKLRVENIQGEQKAIDTHYDVGKKVRQAIENIGGAMPEKLPAVPSIRKLISRQERQGKKLLKAVTETKPPDSADEK